MWHVSPTGKSENIRGYMNLPGCSRRISLTASSRGVPTKCGHDLTSNGASLNSSLFKNILCLESRRHSVKHYRVTVCHTFAVWLNSWSNTYINYLLSSPRANEKKNMSRAALCRRCRLLFAIKVKSRRQNVRVFFPSCSSILTKETWLSSFPQ